MDQHALPHDPDLSGRRPHGGGFGADLSENAEILSLPPSGPLNIRGYPGDAFSPGSVLVRIDGRALKEQVATAEAELKSAKRELQIREKVFARYQKLHGDQAVSEEQYDFYRMDRDLNRSKVDRIQAELAHAAIQLGYAEISAPSAGIILRRLHEPGENVRAGEPVLEVADPAKGYKVVLQVPPAVLKQVADSRAIPSRHRSAT